MENYGEKKQKKKIEINEHENSTARGVHEGLS